MRHRFLAYLAAAVLALALFGPTANVSAQADGEAQAQELYRQGSSAYREGDLERARTLFVRSAELHPHPFTILQLGLTAEGLGLAVEAVEYFERYLETNPENAARMRTRIEAIRAAPLPVSITTDPPGAVVLHEREVIAGTPASLDLHPGTYALSITRPGYRTVNHELEVVFGETNELVLALTPSRTRLEVRHRRGPSVRVEVDGVDHGAAPQSLAVEPGTHAVSLRSAAGTLEFSVPVTRGQTAEVETDFLTVDDYHDLRLGLGLRGGVLISTQVESRSPPTMAHVRLEGNLRLACGRTCFTLSGSAGLSPAGSIAGGGSTILLDAMLGAGIDQRLLGPVRLMLRSSVGLAKYTGLDEGDRLDWWPTQAESTGSGAQFFVMGDLTLIFEVSGHFDVLVSPFTYRHVFADAFPGGLSSFGFFAGAGFWL